MNLTPKEKSKLVNIFKNRESQIQEIHDNWKRTTDSDVLLVDGTNTFIRCWSANPAMDENGNHTGGIVGFLKSIGYAIKLLASTRCIIVFDGVGGSFKRRQLFPEYKEHRKGRIRLNRSYEEMSDAPTEEESCRKQYQRMVNYLQILPVNLLSIDHVEADDVIAFLATEYFRASRKVYIMSSDKDFLQLCTGNINVYSPTKKRIYGTPQILEDYQIHPNNFVLYRALDGDASDNVNGIEGAGPKTIVKHFPWLNEDVKHTIDEVISHAINLRNKYKVCENIAEGRLILERNMALMQLRETALTTAAQLHCIGCLDTKKIPKLDRNAFYKLVRDDLLENVLPNHVTWVSEVFDPLDRVTRSE
jgi:5'-3' exonuclease